MEIIDGITLREVLLKDAKPIYEAIKAHRDYFKIWLPFAATLRSVKEEKLFIQSVLSVPREQRNFTYIIEEGKQICGLIGFRLRTMLTIGQKSVIGYCRNINIAAS